MVARARRRRSTTPGPCSPSPPRSPAPTSASCARCTSSPTASARPAPSSPSTSSAEITRLGLDAELEIRHDRSVTRRPAAHRRVPPRVAGRRRRRMSQSWLPALLGAGQHAPRRRLVGAGRRSCAPVRARPTTGPCSPSPPVAGQAPEQRRRCSPACSPRASSAAGTELVVVAGDELREDLVARSSAGPPTVHRRATPGLARARRSRPPTSSSCPAAATAALATARVTKQATSLVGATILVAADRESVTTNALAAEGLGVVTDAPPPALRRRFRRVVLGRSRRRPSRWQRGRGVGDVRDRPP